MEPIETAPKNGERVLVACFSATGKKGEGLMQVDYWHTRSIDCGFEGWGKFNPTYYPATHWMPLPAAPKAEEA